MEYLQLGSKDNSTVRLVVGCEARQMTDADKGKITSVETARHH